MAILALLLIGAFLLWRASNGLPVSLINLYVPAGFELIQVDGEQAETIYELRAGLHTLILRKSGREYGCVIRVSGGGEIYYQLEERDIHPVIPVKYEPGS